MGIRIAVLAKKLDLTKEQIALITCKLLGYDWKEADHPRDKDGKFARGGGGKEGKSDARQKSSSEIGEPRRKNRLPRDIGGFPYRHRRLDISPKDLQKTLSEINTNYSKYEGKKECMHSTFNLAGQHVHYYFINHGYGEYHFFGVEEVNDEE